MTNVTQLQPPSDLHKSEGVRDDKGRYVRGPGRKVGSKNRQSADLMKLIRADYLIFYQKLHAALVAGEQWAAQLYAKYLLPSRTVEMEGAEPEDIKQAFVDGEISADEAKAVATALEKLKNIADIEDIKRHIENLIATAQQQPR
ncbi:hypothetical protein [Bradyrhizobium uaiense]|uniref:Uncharacterized protein n=1 Tax=Bradyrhizobium uaiense TaxID=2594946 RepID=A0A6P1BTW2_9BRAD|nr:hypothetical protein [Bradyrhizobium uaiense]NEV00992.1 hypothetical protein [Bradyrhizobium uaiense]